jgi:hypothetical protein
MRRASMRLVRCGGVRRGIGLVGFRGLMRREGEGNVEEEYVGKSYDH